ncbi:MAG: hypothetical protein IJH87_03210 [Atopobiaceae bacterium]|nr:hypothetical protein [Atopobiaceae bacterium]
MDFSNISSELREKASGLPADELIELAKNEGVELTDEQLNAIAGGSVWDSEPYHVVYCCGNQIKVPEGKKSVQCPTCGAYIIVS